MHHCPLQFCHSTPNGKTKSRSDDDLETERPLGYQLEVNSTLSSGVILSGKYELMNTS